MPTYTFLQLIFFITELSLLILKRSKTSTQKNRLDKRSLLILWIVIGICSALGPYSAVYHIWCLGNLITITYLGIIIFIIGFTIRWIAIAQLGKMFTVDVAIAKEHHLKTTGIYDMVRHPSYFGLMIIIAAIGFCMNSLLSLLILVVPTFTAINYRISVEEKALIDEFGEQYLQYKNKVKKIIPWLY